MGRTKAEARKGEKVRAKAKSLLKFKLISLTSSFREQSRLLKQKNRKSIAARNIAGSDTIYDHEFAVAPRKNRKVKLTFETFSRFHFDLTFSFFFRFSVELLSPGQTHRTATACPLSTTHSRNQHLKRSQPSRSSRTSTLCPPWRETSNRWVRCLHKIF